MVAELLSTSVETETEVVDHDQQDEGPSALPLWQDASIPCCIAIRDDHVAS